MEKFTTKTTFAALAAVVLLSGCGKIGDLALTCNGTEKRVNDTSIREGEAKDVALTIVRDWIGSPKSIHFSTKLGSNFDSVYCETGKVGEQVFKAPNCAKASDVVTFYPNHGKIKVFYSATGGFDKYEADLNCTKAQGIK